MAKKPAFVDSEYGAMPPVKGVPAKKSAKPAPKAPGKMPFKPFQKKGK